MAARESTRLKVPRPRGLRRSHYLDPLIDTARRTRPDKENLFASLEYDRAAWERVQHGIDRWAKR